MIIGITGNYRKKEFFTILNNIYKILNNAKIEFVVSDDFQKHDFPECPIFCMFCSKEACLDEDLLSYSISKRRKIFL